MTNDLETQADALAERITESSPTWSGALTEQRRFGQIPPTVLRPSRAGTGNSSEFRDPDGISVLGSGGDRKEVTKSHATIVPMSGEKW